MTIKEIQELIGFMDEKSGATADMTATSNADANVNTDDVCRRFCGIVREANAAGIDLTGSLAGWLVNEERPE